jgi:predicted PurR-regulated permease PerM
MGRRNIVSYPVGQTINDRILPVQNMFNIDLKDRKSLYQMIAGLVAVTFILTGCLIILAPFFPAILLAIILSLSAWPAFSWLNTRLNNRTALAATIITLLLACAFIAPLVIIGTSTAENFEKVYGVVQTSLQGDTKGKVTGFLGEVPYVGDDLQDFWTTLTSDKERLSAMLKEYGGSASSMLLKFGASIGRGLADLTLGVLIAYFFFRYGTRVAVRTTNLIETFGGERGQHLLHVSKNTLIGVVYGMMGTALVQGVLAAVGFLIAGLPGPTFLGLLTFLISFVPGGPPLVWIPAALWLYNGGETGMAIFIALWGAIVIGSIDNVLRPYFVSRGANLPFVLVLLGIIGGVLAYGFIGIFIGPTLLALAYTLIIEWSTTRSMAFAGAADKEKPPKKKGK